MLYHILTLCLISLIVDCVNAHNVSNDTIHDVYGMSNRRIFNKNVNLWTKIILEGGFETQDLGYLTTVDKIRNNIGKKSGILQKAMEQQIKLVIKDLQMTYQYIKDLQIKNKKIFEINNFNCMSKFINASCDGLMQQYLHGFDGELYYMLHYNSICMDLTVNHLLIKLLKLLKDYKKRYPHLIYPMHTIDASSNDTNKAQFENFMAIHKKSQSYVQIIQNITKQHPVINNKLMWAWINNKLMMQVIGFKIGYPGILALDLTDGYVKNMWMQEKHYVTALNGIIGAQKLCIELTAFLDLLDVGYFVLVENGTLN
eukprot:212608_1